MLFLLRNLLSFVVTEGLLFISLPRALLAGGLLRMIVCINMSFFLVRTGQKMIETIYNSCSNV